MTGPAKRSGWQEGQCGTSHYFRPGEFKSVCGHGFRIEGSRVYRSPMTTACLTCHARQKLPPKPKAPVQLPIFPGFDLSTGKLAS